MQKVLEKAYEAGKATEEEALDGVMALGKAYAWMDEWDGCRACYKRAKEGNDRLLRQNHTKSVVASLAFIFTTPAVMSALQS